MFIPQMKKVPKINKKAPINIIFCVIFVSIYLEFLGDFGLSCHCASETSQHDVKTISGVVRRLMLTFLRFLNFSNDHIDLHRSQFEAQTWTSKLPQKEVQKRCTKKNFSLEHDNFRNLRFWLFWSGSGTTFWLSSDALKLAVSPNRSAQPTFKVSGQSKILRRKYSDIKEGGL